MKSSEPQERNDMTTFGRPVQPTDVLGLIHQALSRMSPSEPCLNDVVRDRTGSSDELVITIERVNGHKQDFVVRAADITEAERNS